MTKIKKTDPADLCQMNIVRSLMMEKLLSDRQPEKLLLRQEALDNGLVLPSRIFFLLHGTFLDVEQDAELTLPSSYEQLIEQTQTILQRHLQTESFTSFSCMINEDICVLVCLKQTIEPGNEEGKWRLREQLTNRCIAAREEVLKRFGFTLQMMSSSLLFGFNELRAEHLKSDYSDPALFNTKPIMFPDDTAPFLFAPVGQVAERLRTLECDIIHAAEAREWKKCDALFESIMQIEATQYPLCNHINGRAYERMMEVFSVSGMPLNNPIFPALNSHLWRKSLEVADTEIEIRAIVQELLMGCEEYFLRAQQPMSRLEDIMLFVDENITDPELCAGMICEHFSISVSYLSHAFKDYHGIRLIDYIQQKRIELSKRLLLQDDPYLNIEEVALLVGYSGTLTFGRAFKRAEGVPPGAWRRLAEHEKEDS